jgi:hypothetical protein
MKVIGRVTKHRLATDDDLYIEIEITEDADGEAVFELVPEEEEVEEREASDHLHEHRGRVLEE